MLGASVGASPFYVPYPNAHESREQHGTSGCPDPHFLGVGARIGRECRSVRLVWLWPQSTTPPKPTSPSVSGMLSALNLSSIAGHP